MEHLPIVIFEIVLCVFLAFAALAGILFQQIEEKNKKIKKLESELGKPEDPQYVDEWFRFKKMF